jgi:hypothetical protein
MKIFLIGLTLLVSLNSHAREPRQTSVYNENCVTLDSSDYYENPTVGFYTALCGAPNAYTIKLHQRPDESSEIWSMNLLYRGIDILALNKTPAYDFDNDSKLDWYFGEGYIPNALVFQTEYLTTKVPGRNVYNSKTFINVIKLEKDKACIVSIEEKVNQSDRGQSIAENIKSYKCLDSSAN